MSQSDTAGDSMTTRERFRAIMNFQPFDRLPIVEWAAWWDKTIDRWHGEGLPASVTDRYDINEHFGQDIYKQGWFRAISDNAPPQAHHGAGIVADESDYENLSDCLYNRREKWAVDEERLTRWADEQAEGRIAVWITVDGFFWFPRVLMGIERHLYAFYDQPDLMHRINSDLADWIIRIVDKVCRYCTPDFFTFAEDMSYNHGSMLSKELFNEFLRPYYDRVIPELAKRGIIPIVDSDGDITTAAGWFQEAGVEGILPLERQAGVDIAQLRDAYPQLKWIGHFDKMVMHKGEVAMRAEFERLVPTAARGGFIISCDHQTPPGVSYEDYRLYMSLFAEYAAKAGELSRREQSGPK